MASPPVVPKAKGGALPQNVGNAGARLAQRVESALGKALHKEPKQIDPRKILVSQHNRMGAPPNVQYIHKTLLKSFLEKGYDYSRPAVGICVEVKSPEGKRKLLEHNKKLTSPLMSPLLRLPLLAGAAFPLVRNLKEVFKCEHAMEAY